MGDLDGARIVITTGNSGHPFSAHYGDLIDEWRTGGTIPLPFSAAAIEAATTEMLTLTP
jgi:penicillin amidase